jgi:hypothetical protein
MPLTEPGVRESAWRKSRRSITNGDCVEVAPAVGVVLVRDSKYPNGVMLGYPASSWRFFLSSAKQGDFDVSKLPYLGFVPRAAPATAIGTLLMEPRLAGAALCPAEEGLPARIYSATMLNVPLLCPSTVRLGP